MWNGDNTKQQVKSAAGCVGVAQRRRIDETVEPKSKNDERCTYFSSAESESKESIGSPVYCNTIACRSAARK